jgi:signal transduction histidine kinase
MRWLLYLRLIVLTAGTLLPFFWMVVILGHRRQRNFERVFFFLCLALTCFCGCGLLALNAQLFYGAPPHGLLRFAWTFLCLGLFFVPPLILHLHVEYAALRDLSGTAATKKLWLAFAWIPAVALSPKLVRTLLWAENFDFARPTHVLGFGFQIWLTIALGVAGAWQWRFVRAGSGREEKAFHRSLAVMLLGMAVIFGAVAVRQKVFGPDSGDLLSAVLMMVSLLPLGIMVGNVERLSFLQIGRQRNLIYAVFSVFLALLYLSLVRRVGEWLEPYLPPEATAALLLFLPVVFFEPLQRFVRRLLQSTAQKEMDRVSPLAVEIHREARKGDLPFLLTFIEETVRDRLQFQNVWIQIIEPKLDLVAEPRTPNHGDESFSLYRPGRLKGSISVRPHGAMVSGESIGAMRFLAESIAGAIDTCLVVQEKLQLERELAERERLVLVGQMAASISHNLKNPLGSIKTILQVQMESTELPPSLRNETQMVLDEINRLSARLNQLLQFSRPGPRSKGEDDHCDANQVAENVGNVFRHEAERRGVGVEVKLGAKPLEVAANAEITNDVLSNLLLNALEAAPQGGHVSLELTTVNGHCRVLVEDDGAGVPPNLKEKILQPFFTTKARGTGLGLAIVVRRVEELGGKLEVESPIRNNRGSRFSVTLPLAKERHS